ncbi:MAG: hypothetical protein LCH93_16760 [Proteobacteria bacterium]|nr:hypothetical protein [Pseudomonadota bacterium]
MSNWWTSLACLTAAVFGGGAEECKAQNQVAPIMAEAEASSAAPVQIAQAAPLPPKPAQQAAQPVAPPAAGAAPTPPPAPKAFSFEAPAVALEKGAHACVGILFDALRSTVEGEHAEYSSWHAQQPGTRTFWTAQVEKGTNRAAFVSATPVGDRRCDASAVRVSYSANACKAVIQTVIGKPNVSQPTPIGDATLINRDATGRTSIFMNAGAGCVTLEMATLYGQ